MVEQGLTFTAVGKDLNVGPHLIRKWKKSFEEDGTLETEVTGTHTHPDGPAFSLYSSVNRFNL